MIKFILLSAIFAIAYAAAPPSNLKEVPIIAYNSVFNGDGSYKYSYESGDGTKAEESGQLVGEAETVRGSFSFVGKDGQTYSVTYTADENGFVPQAAHLPVPPPIPEAIQRSIEYNLAHPEEDKSQK
ncbi:endocuticle structural glycoprotein SgAbd-4-like [Periplaneta americana]|uniref:endocuticle structural glycoprotein SgAbd-4-like n=1 Tax=Periplaneta americana TaxID=6978 RepID=UPI0037E842F2